MITLVIVTLICLTGVALLQRLDAAQSATFDEMPERTPNPGARDCYSMASATLGRAPVPRWK